MSKENLQGILLGIVVIGLIGLGIMMFSQSMRLAQLSEQMSSLSQKQVVNLQPSVAVPTPKSDTQAPDPQPVQPSSNIFDALKNRPGDIVAGLKVLSVGAPPGIQLPLGNDNVVATFLGSVTLSGSYDIFSSTMSGEDMVCFTPANATERAKLPTLSSEDPLLTRFCFSNLAQARAAFGPGYGQGAATIVIDKYELWYAGAEVTNRAELREVLSKKMDPENR